MSAPILRSALQTLANHLGIPLDARQLSSFELYYELLIDWNNRLNLTRITDPAEVALQHFADALTCGFAFPPGATRLIDVGSGAGLPGLPLKIVLPELKVTLLESVGKKAAFLRAVVTELGLADVLVVAARAEDLGHDRVHREQYDVAVARAVGRLAVLAELCLPFVRLGGRMIAEKTAGIGDELSAARKAIAAVGGRLAQAREVHLPGLDQPRLLVVVDKVRPTAAQFPRNPGLMARAPIT